MDCIYHWFGVGVFWALVGFVVYLMCGYSYQWIVANKVRFWIYQVCEKRAGDKKIAEFKKNGADAECWQAKHFYRMFADKTYKHYRKGWQIYRPHWVKQFGELLKQQPTKP